MDLLFGEPDEVDRLVEALWTVDGWPKDLQADRKFVADLKVQFPSLDLVDAVQGWKAWLLDHPDLGKAKKVNWRSRFRTWCKNGVQYGRERRERRAAGLGGRRVGGTGGGHSPSPTRAGSPEDFGATRRLDDW